MYKIVIPNSVKKDLKKLDGKAQDIAVGLLEKLTVEPYLGVGLSRQFNYLYKIDFNYFGLQLRIAYSLNRVNKEIHIIHIGTRESFYLELKRRL